MNWTHKLNHCKSLIYLIHGEENLLIKEASHWLKDEMLKGGLEDFLNFIRRICQPW